MIKNKQIIITKKFNKEEMQRGFWCLSRSNTFITPSANNHQN